MTPEDLQELSVAFVAESSEHADLLERSLLGLSFEHAADNAHAIGEAFRAIHSIKGNASLLGLSVLEALGHAGEAVLSRVHRGERGVEQGMVDALLELVDTLREFVTAVERDGRLDGGAELIEAVIAGLQPWMDEGDGVQVSRIVAERRVPLEPDSGSDMH